jgi:hypothetical protein
MRVEDRRVYRLTPRSKPTVAANDPLVFSIETATLSFPQGVAYPSANGYWIVQPASAPAPVIVR